MDNGLKAGLDATAAGEAGAELVGNLSALYDYVVRRLFHANLHNDVQALDEAGQLLENIASAWRRSMTEAAAEPRLHPDDNRDREQHGSQE